MLESVVSVLQWGSGAQSVSSKHVSLCHVSCVIVSHVETMVNTHLVQQTTGTKSHGHMYLSHKVFQDSLQFELVKLDFRNRKSSHCFLNSLSHVRNIWGLQLEFTVIREIQLWYITQSGAQRHRFPHWILQTKHLNQSWSMTLNFWI